MSRIGKKPIPIPKGVTVKIEGNTVLVQGPKGKLDTALPAGIKVEQQDGHICCDARERFAGCCARTGPGSGQQRRGRRHQGLDP
jgi:ribosomal protein L6P/L9E